MARVSHPPIATSPRKVRYLPGLPYLITPPLDGRRVEGHTIDAAFASADDGAFPVIAGLSQLDPDCRRIVLRQMRTENMETLGPDRHYRRRWRGRSVYPLTCSLFAGNLCDSTAGFRVKAKGVEGDAPQKLEPRIDQKALASRGSDPPWCRSLRGTSLQRAAIDQLTGHRTARYVGPPVMNHSASLYRIGSIAAMRCCQHSKRSQQRNCEKGTTNCQNRYVGNAIH